MAASHDIPRALVTQKIDLLMDNLVHIKDETGEFLLHLEDGRIIDTKGWAGWEWTHGVGLFGMWRYFEQTNDPKALGIIKGWFADRFAEGTPTKNINTMAPFITLAWLYEHEDQPSALEDALRQATSIGTATIRSMGATYLSRGTWAPAPDQLVFTSNGRQSIAAALEATVPPGGRCGVESLTYPFIKGIAPRLGITLVPLAMDKDGVRPDAVEKAHREAQLSAIYIQPNVHNPLGITMKTSRRTDLLRMIDKLGIPVIEDNIYGFLDDEPPLAALAPDSCIVLDSLSKKVAPGLTLGFVVPPHRLRERVMAAVRSGGWTASGFAFAAAQRMIGDGTVSELTRLKRLDARARQKLAADRLSDFEIQANEKCYHLWLTLPPHWRSQDFVAAAARRDIALTPSATFSVTPGHAPNAIRLALATPPMDQLDIGLRTLAAMLNEKQYDYDSTE